MMGRYRFSNGKVYQDADALADQKKDKNNPVVLILTAYNERDTNKVHSSEDSSSQQESENEGQ